MHKNYSKFDKNFNKLISQKLLALLSVKQYKI